MPRITPNLWFDTQSLEAAEFYVSVFPSSKVTNVSYYGEAGPGPAGTVLTVDFALDGQEYTAINGGPMFSFSEAVSLLISCADQDEVDHYWAALSEGGEEGKCGWLKDRYGLSWQVVPAGMGEILGDPDQGRAQRAMKAMLGMKKLDLDALRAAAAQAETTSGGDTSADLDGHIDRGLVTTGDVDGAGVPLTGRERTIVQVHPETDRTLLPAGHRDSGWRHVQSCTNHTARGVHEVAGAELDPTRAGVLVGDRDRPLSPTADRSPQPHRDPARAGLLVSDS